MPALRSFWKVIQGKYHTKGSSGHSHTGEASKRSQLANTFGLTELRQKKFKLGSHATSLRDSSDEEPMVTEIIRNKEDPSKESVLAKERKVDTEITSTVVSDANADVHPSRDGKGVIRNQLSQNNIHVTREVSQRSHPVKGQPTWI